MQRLKAGALTLMLTYSPIANYDAKGSRLSCTSFCLLFIVNKTMILNELIVTVVNNYDKPRLVPTATQRCLGLFSLIHALKIWVFSFPFSSLVKKTPADLLGRGGLTKALLPWRGRCDRGLR